MLVITSKLNTDNSFSVSMECKDTTEEEIWAAYYSLSQVVDGIRDHKEEGGDNNGQ